MATKTRTATGLIHVAGVIDAGEAQLLIDCGVGFLGFPLALDHHREDIGMEDAAAIVGELRGRATFFLITYLNKPPAIIDLCRDLDVDMVQLHGDVGRPELERLRRSAPPLRILKSLIVRRDNVEALTEEVADFAPLVDAFIADTHDPVTGATGATGKTHDWAVSRRLVGLSPKPVILAGGLNAENVCEAIVTVRPAGVDVHTGIEGADGRKRRDLTERFVAEVRAGFLEIGS